MSASMQWRNDLDFLRLASDLTQLANEDLTVELEAYLLRMAQLCTDLVELHEPDTGPNWPESARLQ
jgi:ABC-type transporter Mla MlaB component